MITRVKVKNFRSLADVDVELGPLTVLVGRNGAGKTAFIDVLRFVRDALRYDLNKAVDDRGGIAMLRRWMPTDCLDIEINITVTLLTIVGEYSLTIASEQDRYHIKREACRTSINGSESQNMFEINEGVWKSDSTLSPSLKDALNELIKSNVLVFPHVIGGDASFFHVYRFLNSARFYTLYPDRLRIPQKPSSEVLLLENGDNLASTLQHLQQNRPAMFAELVSVLDKVAGDISGLQVKQLGGYLITELEHRMPSLPAWFELAQESDGVVRTLALLATLYQEAGRYSLVIEEPELALHPGVLGVLKDVLREAATRSQILITTQSPDLISRFAAAELRIVERAEGKTQIGLLDETQRDVINDQLFSAGDLLRIEGLHRSPVTMTGD